MIVVVSGFPRSGTSLMMRMVEIAGFPLYTDDSRPPDPCNPDGYFEHGSITRITHCRLPVQSFDGMAVKIVVPLVRCLPRDVRICYRVIMMERHPDALIASQNRLLEMKGQQARYESNRDLQAAMQRILDRTSAALRQRSDVSMLTVRLENLVAEPRREAVRVAAFLDRSPDLDAMTRIVRQPSSSSSRIRCKKST